MGVPQEYESIRMLLFPQSPPLYSYRLQKRNEAKLTKWSQALLLIDSKHSLFRHSHVNQMLQDQGLEVILLYIASIAPIDQLEENNRLLTLSTYIHLVRPPS